MFDCLENLPVAQLVDFGRKCGHPFAARLLVSGGVALVEGILFWCSGREAKRENQKTRRVPTPKPKDTPRPAIFHARLVDLRSVRQEGLALGAKLLDLEREVLHWAQKLEKT